MRVNAMCPGLVETSMAACVSGRAREMQKGCQPGSLREFRHYGHPHETVAAIVFLASGDANYITGQALPVDGGYAVSLNLPEVKV